MEMQCKVMLKKATYDDCDLLFEWRNEKECRENSLNTEVVPYETHCAWFNRRMQDKDTLIYIGMWEKKSVGMVRVDIEETIGKISYSIDCNYRGQGFGGKILEALETEPEVRERISVFQAEVKVSNVASRRCFEKLGYVKISNSEIEQIQYNELKTNSTEVCIYTKILN